MLTVYLIRTQTTGKGKDRQEKSYWTRQGVAFENADGSLNMKLDLFPSLTFNIRQPKETDNESKSEDNTEPV